MLNIKSTGGSVCPSLISYGPPPAARLRWQIPGFQPCWTEKSKSIHPKGREKRILEKAHAMQNLLDSNALSLSEVVHIPSGAVLLQGDLWLPAGTSGVVVFVNGRSSPRDQFVAEVLGEAGIGTLLMDILTPDEEQRGSPTGAMRSDLALVANRLVETTRWLKRQDATKGLKVGFAGTGNEAAAAFMAAADLGPDVSGIVAIGGRPDLAVHVLGKVRCPTRLIVPGHDDELLTLNVDAYSGLRCMRDLHLVAGTTASFKGPGRIQQVADLGAQWFTLHLA